MSAACIRCGYCVPVCPKNLLPQEILWYSRNEDSAALDRLDLQACIECELCNRNCPSNIDLVAEFRASKKALQGANQRQFMAEQAKERARRHNLRQERLASSKADQRKARLARLAPKLTNDHS